jgi:addiction module HigA family antidote
MNEIMKTLPNIHPGEILKEEFLDPMEISAYRLSKETGLSETRISQIINSKRSITAETAYILSLFFGTTDEFWLNLQNHYDLEEIKMKRPELPKKIVRYKIAKSKIRLVTKRRSSKTARASDSTKKNV